MASQPAGRIAVILMSPPARVAVAVVTRMGVAALIVSEVFASFASFFMKS